MNIANFLNTNTEKYLAKPAIGFKKDDKWQEITWPNFRRMIFKTANALKNAGIQEKDKVAIYSDNSAEWIVFDLAVLSLGAITVPIYSTNNKEQAEYIINDSESKIILVGNQEQYDAAYEMLADNAFLKQIIAAKRKSGSRKTDPNFWKILLRKKMKVLKLQKNRTKIWRL